MKMKMPGKADRTEAYIGVGSQEVDMLKIKDAEFSVYGNFGYIIAQNADSIAQSAGKVVREIMPENPWAEAAGCIMEIAVTYGLCGLRNALKRKDAYTANKYIIQLLRYCKDDLSQFPNVTVDSYVKGVLRGFAFDGSEAEKIYATSQIVTLDQLPHVIFNEKGREAIGYFLYYMERAFGNDCRRQRKLIEAFEFLNLDNSIWDRCEDYYIFDANRKRDQQTLVTYLFGNIKSDAMHVDPRYFQRSLRKLGQFCPEGTVKKRIDTTNKIVDAFMNEEQITATMIAETSALIFEGREDNSTKIDGMLENLQRSMHNLTGLTANDFNRTQIDKKTIDQVKTVHS